MKASNRTSLELKQLTSAESNAQVGSSNRTSLELKHLLDRQHLETSLDF